MSYATDTAIEGSKPNPRFTAVARVAPPHTQRHACRPRHRPSAEEVLAHYLKRVEPEIAASFTEPQREAIRSILGARGMTKHAVEIRHAIPFGKRRFYVVCLMGREQRSLGRLRREHVASWPFNLLVYLSLAALVTAPALGMVLAQGL